MYAQVNPVAAGALTGGLFKAGAGVRGAALASAIGAGLAAAAQKGLRFAGGFVLGRGVAAAAASSANRKPCA